MDKIAKAKIKQLVLNLRRDLERDIDLGLRPLGIFAEREWLSKHELPHRDEENLRKRARITAVVQATIDQGYTRQEAVQEYIRRTALTYLIQVVGLKCMETRQLIDEVITTRDEYGGRSLFHRDFRYAYPNLAAQPDDALMPAIEAACRVVPQHIRKLFDPGDEWSIIKLRVGTLKKAIAQINSLPIHFWLEDEIIGWIYQFYRVEDRDRVRKRGQPQKADDVAAINQFYTPRWIVKFLVDNTLGRLWLEMHPDSRLRQSCEYLVPTSDLPQPNDAPVREAKPPWEIRLLDPACGTMHFAFYASEVFLEIYKETQSRGWANTPPLPNGSSFSELTEDQIVSFIFHYNLFGITIDLWATRLATLSLYMKLKTLHPDAAVTGMNVICADAHLAEDMRQHFLEEFDTDPKMKDALREIFATMSDIGQIGSLFRPREQLQYILQDKQHPVVKWEEQKRLALEKGRLPIRQMGLGEIGEPNLGWPAFRELDEILEKLQDFARKYWVQQNYAGHLLALETAENLRLLDVLSQSYDVVVMNPPYGKTTKYAKNYLRRMYPQTYSDLYAAFLEQALRMIKNTRGYTGALVSRSFMFLSSFNKLRQEILLPKTKITTLAELGLGVLDDATVRPAAIVFSPKVDKDELLQTIFFRLSSIEPDEKPLVLLSAINNLDQAIAERTTFCRPVSTFETLPGAPFTYWASSHLVSKFLEFPSLDVSNSLWRVDGDQIASVRTGLGTRDDARFLRFFWEVPLSKSGDKHYWPYFAKGGTVSPYYRDIGLVVEWTNDGANIKSFPKSTIRCEEFYFREGITYTLESEKNSLGAYYLPPDCIFGDKGPAIFINSVRFEIWSLLAILNSFAVAGFIRLLTPDRTRTVGFVSSLPIPEYIDPIISNKLADHSRQIFDLKAAWDTGNEISTRFTAPWLLQIDSNWRNAHDENIWDKGLEWLLGMLGKTTFLKRRPTPSSMLAGLLEQLEIVERMADQKLQQLQAWIDETVYELYHISPVDRSLLEQELGDRPLELIWSQMESKSKQEKRREHVRRLFSYFILQALKDHPVGILPLVDGTGEPTVLERLREQMEAVFGAEEAFQLEDDAGEVLGRSIASWMETEFSRWHIQLYKRRPIIWHIVSPQRTFSTFLYYHKLDRDTLRKVRNIYLWALRDRLKSRVEAVRITANYSVISQLEAALDDLEVLNERLGRIIDSGYDPIISDGVRANLLPLQKVAVLRQKKIV